MQYRPYSINQPQNHPIEKPYREAQHFLATERSLSNTQQNLKHRRYRAQVYSTTSDKHLRMVSSRFNRSSTLDASRILDIETDTMSAVRDQQLTSKSAGLHGERLHESPLPTEIQYQACSGIRT